MICNIFKSDILNFLVDSVLIGVVLVYLDKKSPQIKSLLLSDNDSISKKQPAVPFAGDNFFMMK